MATIDVGFDRHGPTPKLEANTPRIILLLPRRRRFMLQSRSRAEGYVNDIVNSRMTKRRRMRWPTVNAHRVTTVRAALLEGRLSSIKQEHFAA